MDHLHWPLSVLGKAIHHKNLSAAAQHIGLSQPQLSRLVSQLEAELNVTLLDRTVRRKSGWTPVAFKVAEVYFQNSRKLTAGLNELQSSDRVQHLSIGSLEGLVPLAIKITQALFKNSKIAGIELNVYDLSELEEIFEKDKLDLALTCRAPGRTKPRYLRALGWQDMRLEGKANSNLQIMSPFEHSTTFQTAKRNTHRRDKAELANTRIVVSNSLALRKILIRNFGGVGKMPTDVMAERPGTTTEMPVYLLGSEVLPPSLWEKLEKMKLSTNSTEEPGD